MNSKSSAWTGRAPRSMSEAFNPYTNNTLEPMRDEREYKHADRALYVVAVLAILVVLIFKNGASA